ncbi:ATP-binding protein [Coraliomargarita akajimensis]|nr:ATP-binding protein [Coraliomargarita akajimensis]
MTGLLSAFYLHEKEILIREFDNSLMAPITSLIPHFAPPPPDTPHDMPLRGPGAPPLYQSTSEPAGPNDQRRPPPPGAMGPNTPRPPQLGHRASPPNETDEERFIRQTAAAAPLLEQGLYLVAIQSDGTLYFASENAPKVVPHPLDNGDPVSRKAFIRSLGTNRECVHMAPGQTCVIIGASTHGIRDDLLHLRITLLGTGIGIVLFAHVIGWLLVGRSLKPIRSISQTAAQISAGNLSQRIDLNDTESELGQMGEVLNNTFSKLDSAFEQQVRFTADASHELRTPISVILAKCQFALMREREPEKYVAALKTCEASAQHIRGLVESLLELARIDSGEFTINTSPGDLAKTAQETVDMLNTLAEAKSIRLTLKHDATPADFDSSRMHQVATNLIGNAIKYTQEGGTIDVHVHGQGSFAVLEVHDTGPGIEARHIPHLFDRFYRSSDERSDDRRSTGLGLAITKAIVDAHRGQITVESELGAGSCFIVRLPA